jgi:hypothetical protein
LYGFHLMGATVAKMSWLRMITTVLLINGITYLVLVAGNLGGRLHCGVQPEGEGQIYWLAAGPL